MRSPLLLLLLAAPALAQLFSLEAPPEVLRDWLHAPQAGLSLEAGRPWNVEGAGAGALGLRRNEDRWRAAARLGWQSWGELQAQSLGSDDQCSLQTLQPEQMVRDRIQRLPGRAAFRPHQLLQLTGRIRGRHKLE